MTNELSGESRPSSQESLVLNTFPLMPLVAIAPPSGVNPYGRFSAVTFNSILSPA